VSPPDLNTDDGRAAYRREWRAVGKPYRIAGLVLILLGAGYVIVSRYGSVPAGETLTMIAYGLVAAGWALFLTATFLRNRHHKRRLAEGL
jgi:hypothetical protein